MYLSCKQGWPPRWPSDSGSGHENFLTHRSNSDLLVVSIMSLVGKKGKSYPGSGVMLLPSLLSIHELEIFDDYKPAVLHSSCQCEFVGGFLTIKFRRCIFCKNISDVTLCSFCLFSGGVCLWFVPISDMHSIIWVRRLSGCLLHCKVTFPFVIQNVSVRHFETVEVSLFSSTFHPLVFTCVLAE